tara:strand:+ start:325 stop:762 length:438 start_codon:yes stop_codon:yes gene_type:complete
MGSVLGPNRSLPSSSATSATNGPTTANTASLTLLKKKMNNKNVNNAEKENQNNEVKRIKFQIKEQSLASSSSMIPSIMDWAEQADDSVSSVASKRAFDSPVKQSFTPAPAPAMSPSPPAQVSRTLSYTPAKLPSTTNSALNSVLV